MKRKLGQSAGGLTYKKLFSGEFKDRLIVGCGLSALQQLVGINAVTFYSTEIFRQGVTDPEDRTPLIYTMVVGVVNVLSALATIPILKRFQKKQALLVGNLVLMICLFSISFLDITSGGASPYTKYLVFVYIFFFGFSLGSITWMLVGQILPDLGVGVAVLMNWLTAMIVAQFFPAMISGLGLGGSFLIFGVFCLGGMFFIEKYVKEFNKGSQQTAISDSVELSVHVKKDLNKALLNTDYNNDTTDYPSDHSDGQERNQKVRKIMKRPSMKNDY